MKQKFSKQNVLRLLALAICIVMCFTLGACGNNSASSELVIGDNDEYVGFDSINVGDAAQNNTSDDANSTAQNSTTTSNNGVNNNTNNSATNNNANNAGTNSNLNNGTNNSGAANNTSNNSTNNNGNTNNATNNSTNNGGNKNNAANNNTNNGANTNSATNNGGNTNNATNNGTNNGGATNNTANNNTNNGGNTNNATNNGANNGGTTNNNTNNGTNNGGTTNNTTNNNANNTTNNNVNNGNNANNSNSNSDDFLSQIPKTLQGTTVTFAVWGDENAPEYAKVIKHFTKKTKINVKWVTYNEDKYVSTIVEQNAAGKGPDIVIMNFTFPTVLETVQELPSQFDINDGFWDPRVTKAFSVKGKNYFVNSYKSPFANGGTFVYYNKQIFSNNNIKSPQDYVNEGSWTWENLAKCVREVNQKGFDGGTIFPQYVWPSTGSVMVNYDPNTATFSSGLANSKDKNNILSALQYVAELCKDGVISNNPVHRLTTGQTALALVEHFGMKYNGWFKGISPSALGIVNIPNTFNGQKAEYISTCQRGYGIGKNAKNIDGAYYVLRYFLDIDNYDDANADIFLNKNMERFYKEEFLPMYKTREIQVEYMQVPLALAGSPWTTTSPASWTEVFAAGSPEEVVTALNARVNIVENAAKKATEKVQSIIK